MTPAEIVEDTKKGAAKKSTVTKAAGASVEKNTGSGRKAEPAAKANAESSQKVEEVSGEYEAYGVGQELPVYLM